jgi:hypothetical protein
MKLTKPADVLEFAGFAGLSPAFYCVISEVEPKALGSLPDWLAIEIRHRRSLKDGVGR